MSQSLLVYEYLMSEAKAKDLGHGHLCDECHFPPAWKVRPQLWGENSRMGYACGEHIDTVLMKIANSLPVDEEAAPADPDSDPGLVEIT